MAVEGRVDRGRVGPAAGACGIDDEVVRGAADPEAPEGQGILVRRGRIADGAEVEAEGAAPPDADAVRQGDTPYLRPKPYV